MQNCRDTLTEICTCGCKETGDFRKKQRDDSNLNSLKNYQQELENELKTVRDRIRELAS